MLHQLLENHRFVALPWREDKRHGFAVALNPQMDFGAEAALAAPNAPMVTSPAVGVTDTPAGGGGSEARRSYRGSNMLPDGETSTRTVVVWSDVFWKLTLPEMPVLFGKQLSTLHDERMATMTGEENGLCDELPTVVTCNVCDGSSVAE